MEGKYHYHKLKRKTTMTKSHGYSNFNRENVMNTILSTNLVIGKFRKNTRFKILKKYIKTSTFNLKFKPII